MSLSLEEGNGADSPESTPADDWVIPFFTFFNHDHPGNSRLLYHNQFTRLTFSDLDDNGFITWEDTPQTEDLEEPTEVIAAPALLSVWDEYGGGMDATDWGGEFVSV